MDRNQLILALIGAFSTLLAALLNSRSRRQGGAVPVKRSWKRSFLKFSFYFLLGGVATYWVINSLLPFGKIEERLTLLETRSASTMGIGSGPGPADSLIAMPVGSLVLSMAPPERFPSISGRPEQWIPADGRLLDTTCRYARLTGFLKAPDLKPIPAGEGIIRPDSLHESVSSPPQQKPETASWYVRIN